MDFDLNLYDLSPKSNIWNLELLKYNGPLFHYTTHKNYKKIIHPMYAPKEHALLRFSRIDYMTKNDDKEQKSIQDVVKKSAKKMLENGDISIDFANSVINYQPQNTGSYMFFCDSSSLSEHSDLPSGIMDYGKTVYYVACFSKSPRNEHIKKSFRAKKCIKFSEDFLRYAYDQKSSESSGNGFSVVPALYMPFYGLNRCGLGANYYIREVVYDKHQKQKFIKSYLKEIYQNHTDLKSKKWLFDIQDMYSLFEAFFKRSKYKREAEVRFVIRLPSDMPDSLSQMLSKYHIQYGQRALYIPIDTFFLSTEA